MTFAELRSTRFAFGANCTPPAELVGGFVYGSLNAPRQVVTAEPLFRAYAECELPPGFDPEREAFETVFRYPRTEYVRHLKQYGSPKGYAGAAACCRIPWDIDRADDLAAALTETRKLVRFLRDRYGEQAEHGLSVFFSGAKGFHLTLVAVPGFDAMAHTPAVVKRLALAVAAGAGVKVDASIYDRQRLFRLPNTLHPKTGLYKRWIDPDDFDRVTVASIRDAAKHPAGFAVRYPETGCEQLADDWQEAERIALTHRPISSTGERVAPPGAPVVPKFVRDFIGFGDVQEPGRAITLFRCAAALAEAGTPSPVVFGLLAEPALKTGLDTIEVEKQIRAGIGHGTQVTGVSA